ncbi:MAG: glycosyltransferase [Kineosporiaceae bacterium]
MARWGNSARLGARADVSGGGATADGAAADRTTSVTSPVTTPRATPDATRGSTTLLLSVVVATRNEVDNVDELLRRLVPSLPRGSEVVFVDDSDDGTPGAVTAAAARSPVPVRLVHRPRGERPGGLGGAVAAGMRVARGTWCVVMDGDLQHPPELVPVLVAEGERSGSQLVVGSRYTGTGDASGLATGRRVAVSTWATRATRAFFPRRLAAISDPMSGFFAVRRDAVDLDALRPNGFKILLEIAVRSRPLRAAEVPFRFAPRFAGESKASLREGLRLVVLMTRLWLAARTRTRTARLVAFGLVGASGIVVNSLVLWAVTGRAGAHYAWGALAATEVSTSWNWLLLEVAVFHGVKRHTRLRRYLSFSAVNHVALLVRVPVLAVLIDQADVNYLVANVLSLLFVFGIRFVLSDSLIFRRSPVSRHPTPTPTPIPIPTPTSTAAAGHRAPVSVVDDDRPVPSTHVGTHEPGTRYFPYRYDITDVATIGSAVRLPELEWFRAPFLSQGPFDIEIRVGRVGRARTRSRLTRSTRTGDLLYEEHLGGRGANFRLELTDGIRITAGPLLEHSPHVLYTNVVEALLRFLAVRNGRVLLHSACVELSGTGVMLSARTDTGKTGTILRMLRERGARFLSDDMTVVEQDGTAHCFPKPLTISHHTLRAVNSRTLSRAEWRRLRLQSRLHSKEGRRFGLRLAEMNLPIMTFNAVTQAIVPPPKYDADRLVPCDVVRQVGVTDLFVIERGPSALAEIGDAEALDELIANTDDAYGFPPFRYVAPSFVLGGMDYEALRARERELLAEALRHVRVRRMTRDDFSWADAIADLVGAERAAAAVPDDVTATPPATVIDLRDPLSAPQQLAAGGL